MRPLNPRLYKLSLYALLHDVGKPVLRFARRFEIEKGRSEALANAAKNVVETRLGDRIGQVANERHDEISKAVIGRVLGLSLDEGERSYFDEVIKEVDALAASERGLDLATRGFMESVQTAVAKRVEEKAKLPYAYSHEFTPMLAPTWLLFETGYVESTGIQAVGEGQARWSGADERKNIAVKIFHPMNQAVEKKNKEKLVELLVELLARYSGEPVWLPIRPLLPGVIAGLEASRIENAMEESSYSEVVLLLLSMLWVAREIYHASSHPTRGLVDTVENVLKATSSLVPSAVYWSIVPDISLYSHSKLVAAFTSALHLSSDKRLRLLVIDANNIQGFIAAPVKAAAASRVIRGRSLLLEILMDALTEYALELFGGLPRANVVVSEGGTLDVVVPNIEGFDERVAKLRDAGRRLAGFLGGILGFTVAYSRPFTIQEANPQRAIKTLAEGSGEQTFIDVLESLAEALAVEKARSGVRPDVISVEGVVAGDSDVEDFDSLTGEPVLKDARMDPFKLRVSADTAEYAERLAGPGKLSEGDVLSTATHLSLAIGTVARELSSIISIHVYKYENGVPVPDADAVYEIYKELSLHLSRGSVAPGQLLVRGEFEQGLYSGNIAFTPLPPVGALYVLVTSPLRAPGIYNMEEAESASLMLEGGYRVSSSILGLLSKILDSPSLGDRSVRIKIWFVNAPHLFLFTENIRAYDQRFMVKELAESFQQLGKASQALLRKGVDVSFGFTLLGLYHPARYTLTEKGEVESASLVDLDEFGVIAVAKMDADLFGEVRGLYSMFPSRLVTLSDLVNIVVAGKAYFKAAEIARGITVSGERGNLDVIPLYAGGDDVTIYGKWSHVVYYVSLLGKEIRRALPPLSLSIGVSLGDSKEPLLHLYKWAVHLLEEYAKAVRASCVIGAPYRVLYPSKPQETGREAIYRVIPLEEPSRFYKWVEDPIAGWNLDFLGRLLGGLIGVEKGGWRSELEDLGRELYILLTIANEYEEALSLYEEAKRGKIGFGDYKARILPIEVYYAYAWSRRKEELARLKRLFEEIEAVGEKARPLLLQYPDDIVAGRSVEEALRLLLGAKPVLDLVVLALRRYEDSVKPSKLIEWR